jgi:hypothetical protein
MQNYAGGVHTTRKDKGFVSEYNDNVKIDLDNDKEKEFNFPVSSNTSHVMQQKNQNGPQNFLLNK